ncbi:MAG: cellulase family glycosylhydrolase [Candidatus Falkowbacteria bacterium]
MKKNNNKNKTKLRFLIIPIIILVLVLTLAWFFKVANNYPKKQDLNYRLGYFGVTFSIKMAKELGLDWKEAFIATIDDLNVKNVRLPVYWDQITPRQNEYNFADYDWILNEGKKRNVEFVLNVGYRLPRWPECHAPGWMSNKNKDYRDAEVLKMIETVVNRYKDRGEVEYWQVENEPFLDFFGECPESDVNFLQKEIDLVRSLDSRSILISGSGELSTWQKESKVGDIFGTTMYRVVWGPYFGYVRYPLPAAFYRLKADLAHIPQEKRIISELQAEPWVPSGSMKDMTDAEAQKSFSIEQFKANTQFAINVNFQKTYLWGVEWWYKKYKDGQSQYWDFAKTLFK